MPIFIVEVDNDGFKVYDSAGNLIDPAKDSSAQSILSSINSIKDTAGIKKITDPLPAGTNVIGAINQGSAGASLWKVDGSGATQPISAASLPLPAGAATETTLSAIKDTAGIKKITDALPTGDNIIGRAKLTDGTLTASILDDSGTYRLKTEAKIAAGGAKQKVYLVDGTNEVELAVADAVAKPTNTKGIIIAGVDVTNAIRFARIDGLGNLKVTSQPPQPPPGTTELVLAVADDDLSITAPPTYHDTESSVFANGLDIYLQLFTAGAAGDPSERGSRVDVLWREGAGPTYHTIERMYVGGQSVTIVLPDIHQARDGTQLVGNGTNTRIVLRRYRLSNAAQEVDAIIRGYTE